MISTKLRNLARSLAERADAGSLTKEEFAVAIQVMYELAEEAATLERASVPADQRNFFDDVTVCDGDKVVSIFSRSLRDSPPGGAA